VRSRPLRAEGLRVRGNALFRLGQPDASFADASKRYSIWKGLNRHVEAWRASYDAWQVCLDGTPEKATWAETSLNHARKTGDPIILYLALMGAATSRSGPDGIMAAREAIRTLEGNPELAKEYLVGARRDLTMNLWNLGMLDQAASAAARWHEAAKSQDAIAEAIYAALWIIARIDEGLPEADRRTWAERALELAEGLEQLENYLDGLNLTHGTLVIFDRRKDAPPAPERTRLEEAQTPKGYRVRVLRG
jgi:hypothetical protein